MMKLLITSIFLFFTLKATAQLAIVKSEHAFVNVFEKASLNSKAVSKINTGDVFSISPFDEGLKGFTKIWYHPKPKKVKNFLLADDVKEGFVPNNNILLLADLRQLKSTKTSNQSTTFNNQNLQVLVETKKISSKHQVVIKDNGAILINNKPQWGYIQNPALEEIKSIVIKIQNNIYSIPREAFQNLFQPNLQQTKVYIKNESEFYIGMSNADGSESYEVVWQFLKGELKKQTVMQIIP